MDTIRITGVVDDRGQLIAHVPPTVRRGEVELLVVARGTGDEVTDDEWMAWVAQQWDQELSDSRQDIYSLADGIPSDGSR